MKLRQTLEEAFAGLGLTPAETKAVQESILFSVQDLRAKVRAISSQIDSLRGTREELRVQLAAFEAVELKVSEEEPVVVEPPVPTDPVV